MAFLKKSLFLVLFLGLVSLSFCEKEKRDEEGEGEEEKREEEEGEEEKREEVEPEENDDKRFILKRSYPQYY
nr:somuncurin 2 [Pleurodema somuncurensis]